MLVPLHATPEGLAALGSAAELLGTWMASGLREEPSQL